MKSPIKFSGMPFRAKFAFQWSFNGVICGHCFILIRYVCPQPVILDQDRVSAIFGDGRTESWRSVDRTEDCSFQYLVVWLLCMVHGELHISVILSAHQHWLMFHSILGTIQRGFLIIQWGRPGTSLRLPKDSLQDYFSMQVATSEKSVIANPRQTTWS